MHKLLLLTLVCATKVAGYSTGAPLGACAKLAPNHPQPAQTSTAPFQVAVQPNSWMKSQPMKVSITGEPFNGFILQARRKSDGEGVGMFESSSIPEGVKLGPCMLNNEQISITHKDGGVEKTNLTFTWMAPDSNEGDIYFQAAVAKSKDVYWIDLKSSDVTYDSRATTTAAASSLTVNSIALLLSLAVYSMSI